MSRPVYLYAIGRDEGPIKLGISENPVARASALQVGCHFPLKVIHVAAFHSRELAAKEEAELHRMMRGHRLHGEWFDMCAQLATDGIDCIAHTSRG